MSEYLPAIIAFLGVALTAYINYRLGKLKTSADTRTADVNANDAVRDDLLKMIEFYETRDKRLNDLLEKLQARVAELLDQVDQLRSDNRRLEYELKITRTELEKFERKVFYRPEQKTGEEKS